MYWSPNFLAVVFKKQEISQQVVTRMQDLASEFSKIFLYNLHNHNITVIPSQLREPDIRPIHSDNFDEHAKRIYFNYLVNDSCSAE